MGKQGIVLKEETNFTLAGGKVDPLLTVKQNLLVQPDKTLVRQHQPRYAL